MSDEFEFSYSPHTFPYHPECYTWPRIAMYNEDGATELNVHCLLDMNRKQFSLMGFVGIDREDQISAVIFMAQQMDAKVIVFKGVGINDGIVQGLMMGMTQLDPDKPDQLSSLMPVEWPTRFQRKVLREAIDMAGRGEFHEDNLAMRMNASVEEIRQHLRLLADLGLMSEA